jgi:hypothetical protein
MQGWHEASKASDLPGGSRSCTLFHDVLSQNSESGLYLIA